MTTLNKARRLIVQNDGAVNRDWSEEQTGITQVDEAQFLHAVEFDTLAELEAFAVENGVSLSASEAIHSTRCRTAGDS